MEKTENLRGAQSMEEVIGTTGVRNETLKKIGVVGAVVLIAFLLGFMPMWLSARSYENERDTARKNLRLSVLQNKLATAAINAERGEKEQARQQASDFFTGLRAEFDREESAFDPAQRETVQKLLVQRDETITLLARGDAASVDRLAEMYFAFTEMRNSSAQKNKY